LPWSHLAASPAFGSGRNGMTRAKSRCHTIVFPSISRFRQARFSGVGERDARIIVQFAAEGDFSE
jgi:hypothetical protein